MKRSGLIEEIDRQMGPSEQKVSCGEGVQCLMPDYLHNKPVDDVLIKPGLVTEDFTMTVWGTA